MKKIHVTSLGCPKNLVDSEVMLGVLEKDGWCIEQNPEESDVLLINTCGFIQPAVEEAIDEILAQIEIKVQFPQKIVVVTGCLVQRYQHKLKNEFPEVDLFVGTESAADIAKLLDGLIKGRFSGSVQLNDRFLMDATVPRKRATPIFRAWLKITEGCSNCCSYCMIPSIRGGLRSREIDDLVLESIRLEDEGVKEITLIAQDLTAFGNERGHQDSLSKLVEKLVVQTSIPWIRLMYLYPTGITERLLDVMATHSRIVPYLDIPFQHVSDHILKRMNRRYGRADLYRLVEKIRSILPDIAFRTTYLLGFPGETEKDVNLLEEFIADTQMDHVGVFAYANEEGAASESFPGQCSDEEKRRRVEHIMTVQADISRKKLQKYVGRREPVLVEGLSRETDLLLEGRTRYQAPEIDGCVLINEGEAKPGDVVMVRIDESLVYDLVGGIEN